jgi:cyclohexanone monooxygenase
VTDEQQTANAPTGDETLDAIVVGAGFAGLCSIHQLAQLGLSLRCYEAGNGVGGTWFWNKYPGAQCDVESMEYSYAFSDELQQEWDWSRKYSPQSQILAYANHVADRFDLRRHIQFDTRVRSTTYDEAAALWSVALSTGQTVRARFVLMGTGNLSTPRVPDIPGLERFKGTWYHSSRWPEDGVDFSGKRVAVIGTGSTGIQIIPIVAQSAGQVVVFQRSPNFVVQAFNRDLDAKGLSDYRAIYPQMRERARQSNLGVADIEIPTKSALADTAEARNARYEALWQRGSHPAFLSAYNDLLVNKEANDTAAEFVRSKIRAAVRDPKVADLLCPTDHPIGAKRLCVGTDYYETYNQPNVTLVDARATPIVEITEKGLRSGGVEHEVDIIVFATGFDAMTGALREIDVRGRGGLLLADKWDHGPVTYLGLMVAGFPNLFVITGPGSPSVKSNVVLSIEQHVEWIARCLTDLRSRGAATIEAEPAAEAAWVAHVNEVADTTLYPQTNSWYTGSNVPGKPRVFMPYVGGIANYRRICDEVAADGYRGFRLELASEPSMSAQPA